jgi:signal transduction histidine kinase
MARYGSIVTHPTGRSPQQQAIAFLTSTHRLSRLTLGQKISCGYALTLSVLVLNEKSHWVDLHACLDSALLILRIRLKKRIYVVHQYGVIPSIEGYYSALYQVFINLLGNSIEALEQAIASGEVITQDKSPPALGERLAQITITTDYPEPNWVLIKITDNAMGIPLENQPQIFQSFFTTKPMNLGVGLGLTICQQIIQDKHHGSLTFTSEPGIGTTFSIRLPTSQSIALRTVS